MIEIFEAISDHYNADPLSVSDLTGIHLIEAPPETDYPYLVVGLVSNVPDFTFTEDQEELLIQFEIHSDNSSIRQVLEIFDLLKGDVQAGEGFDFLDLAINDHVTVSFVRGPAVPLRKDGVWTLVVTYTLLVEISASPSNRIATSFYSLMPLIM
jgi:hypothetical protein